MKFFSVLLFLLSVFCAPLSDAQSATSGQVPKNYYYPVKQLPVGKNELLKAGKLSRIYAEKSNLDTSVFHIAAYTVSMIGKARDPLLDYDSSKDAFPPLILDSLKAAHAGTQVLFDHVRATKMNSTDKHLYLLPPLSLILEGE